MDRRIKEKMRRLVHINWSEMIRAAIERAIEREELRERHPDPREVEEACSISDSIRRPAPGWSSTEEIRNWRERRR